MQQLQAEHQGRHEVTVDSLVAELDEARALAIEVKTPSAAVAASMGKAKLLGLIVDKAEHSGKVQLEKVESVAALKAISDALELLPSPKPGNGTQAPASATAPASGVDDEIRV